ncbi:MAG: hypothetical protein EBQ80_06175 [Proteobacteria bacterium]|nr:hypothetical protein [Pseudomonadota bacterium]
MKMWGLALLVLLTVPSLGWAGEFGSYGGYYAPSYYSPRVEYVTRYVERPVERVVTRTVASNSGNGGERRVSVRTSGRGSYGFNVTRGGGSTNNGYSGPGGQIESPHRGDYEAYLQRLQQYRQQVERAYARGGGAVCGNYMRRPEDCKTVPAYDAMSDAELRSWPY